MDDRRVRRLQRLQRVKGDPDAQETLRRLIDQEAEACGVYEDPSAPSARTPRRKAC